MLIKLEYTIFYYEIENYIRRYSRLKPTTKQGPGVRLDTDSAG